MHRLTRHLRGLLVALAALSLSAGVVVAARPASVEAPPTAADEGLTRASDAAGTTVPVVPDEAALPHVDAPSDGASEIAEDTDAAEGLQAAPTVQGERAQNHGWFVSEAAKAPTPAGFENHGEYVSEVAQSDQGKPAAATAAREAKAAKAAKAPKAAKPASAGNQ